jgi:hypothetical protein
LTLTVDRVGAPDWRVERMVSACKAIDATLTETAREGGSVSYLLKVNLRSDASSGVVRDEIRLLTNDSETPVLPVQVSASIRGELTASPSVLALGAPSSTAGAVGRFLVRASKPFVVRAVEGEGDGFTTAVDDQTAKPVHIVTVSYKPEEGTPRGDLRRVFRLHTDLDGEAPLDLTATVQAAP